jgi:hypothetical protein
MPMTGKVTTRRRVVVAASAGRPHLLKDLQSVVDGIVRSDEPVVVLSSLARFSSPFFSDACTLEISAADDALFQVSFPLADEKPRSEPAATQAGTGDRAIVGAAVTTAFQAPPTYGYPSFAGLVVHSWTERIPTNDDMIIARLLVDHGVSIVQHERLAQSAARAEDRSAKLAMDLIASRTEGEAVGILRVRQQVAREEAINLLRRMSRTSHRTLYEVAAEMVRAGNDGAGGGSGQPRRRRR